MAPLSFPVRHIHAVPSGEKRSVRVLLLSRALKTGSPGNTRVDAEAGSGFSKSYSGLSAVVSPVVPTAIIVPVVPFFA